MQYVGDKFSFRRPDVQQRQMYATIPHGNVLTWVGDPKIVERILALKPAVMEYELALMGKQLKAWRKQEGYHRD